VHSSKVKLRGELTAPKNYSVVKKKRSSKNKNCAFFTLLIFFSALFVRYFLRSGVEGWNDRIRSLG